MAFWIKMTAYNKLKWVSWMWKWVFDSLAQGHIRYVISVT